MSWCQQFEPKETGDVRVMSMALSSLEQRYLDGYREGFREGFEIIAKRLLQDGFDESFVRKHTQFSEEKIQELKNGCQDSR